MNQESNEFTLKEVISNINMISRYIFSKTIYIILIGFLFGLFGFAFSWYKGPTYRATINFVSENTGSDGIGGYASIASQFGIDLGRGGGGAFEGDNLMEMLKSKRLIVSTLLTIVDVDAKKKPIIIYYFKLHPIKKNTKLDIDTVNFISNLDLPNRTRDSILNAVSNNYIKGNLSIDKKDKKLNFIQLSMDDGNETFAKLFVENLCHNAIIFFTEYKTRKASASLKLLQYQADSLRNLLHGSINNYAESVDVNINPLKQKVKTESQKNQVDVQANTVMYTELLRQYALAKVSMEKDTPLIQIIDSPDFPLPKVNMGKLATTVLFSFVSIVLYIFFLVFRFKIS